MPQPTSAEAVKKVPPTQHTGPSAPPLGTAFGGEDWKQGHIPLRHAQDGACTLARKPRFPGPSCLLRKLTAKSHHLSERRGFAFKGSSKNATVGSCHDAESGLAAQ